MLAGRTFSAALRAVPPRLSPALSREPRFHEQQQEIKAMTEFYAQPYSVEHTGFYFDSLESYEQGMERLNKRGCEEVEIQFIDGEHHLCRLAEAADIHQGSVHTWFEALEDLDESAATQLTFLLEDIGYRLEEALQRYEEVSLYPGSAADYAAELIEETCEVPETLINYIDYEAIARDMKLGGEIVEINDELIVTNAHDF
jgi:hypothetical protein